MPSDVGEARSKLERKRERDRRSQRLARERTRARVASLESLVQDIVQQDAPGSSNAVLLQEIAAVREQRDQYAKALEYIAKFIATQATTQISATVSGELCNLVQDSLPNPPSASCPANTVSQAHAHQPRLDISRYRQTGQDCIEHPDSEVLESLDHLTSTNDELQRSLVTAGVEAGWTFDTTTPAACKLSSQTDPIIPFPSTDCECRPQKRAKSRWRLVSETLAESANLAHQVPLLDAMNDDIPVRAVLHGWQAVLEFWSLPELPLIWQILRGMDEAAFARDSGVVERIGCIRIVYRRLAFVCSPEVRGNRDLPLWYFPRPSQDLPHSNAIDFIVWPGVRERFVVHQHRYCSDVYWESFARSLRFLWPFSHRDCYVAAGKTYQVSPLFDQHVGDIKRWTVNADFFSLYPELSSDIPMSNGVPRSVSDSAPLQLELREAMESSPGKTPHAEQVGHNTATHEPDSTFYEGVASDLNWDASSLGCWDASVFEHGWSFSAA